MGQVLHGSATTTEAVRRAIQHSQESLRALARRYGINQKTVAKWKKRILVADLPTGPKEPKSTVLSSRRRLSSSLSTAYAVAAGRLPLCAAANDPHLTRSSLHRCLQRHGIGRLPDVEGDKPTKQKFKSYPIGYFHIDIAEVQTAEGKLYLFVAIDRTSKFAYVELHEKAGKMAAASSCAISSLPFPMLSIPCWRTTASSSQTRSRHRYAFIHIFDRVCREHGIEQGSPRSGIPGQTVRSNA